MSKAGERLIDAAKEAVLLARQIAEAEQRGYQRGIEDALKVMKSWEETGTGPDYSEYWDGAGYAVKEITAAILALLEQTSEPGEKK